MQRRMLQRAVVLALLGCTLAQGNLADIRSPARALLETSTSNTLTITRPAVCGVVNVATRDSCFNSCVTPELNREGYTVNQGSSINFTFAYPITGVVFGGSPNDTFYGAAIPDMTIFTAASPAASVSPPISNPTYTGFTFSPKYATYNVFGGDGTSVELSGYFFDLASRNASTNSIFAPACRFKIKMSIIATYIPPATPSQLYPNSAAPVASLATIKIVIMAVLGMAAVLLLLC
ncbi:hypothetical protein WJX72_004595 [[Myrmecia] bisecta]|uniref:Uncharacterized protein n=1 Tax=[Myrmecia] bisecta TaxID=41462 RepID=A0AAW1PPD0_9CHLO